MTTTAQRSRRQMLGKVPEVTLYFWIVKILCTTVGATFADNINEKLNLGLTWTSVIMGAFLVVALIFQFRANRYTPSLYWLTVVLISVVVTLITDNMTDNFGVSLVVTTIVFAIVLAVVFAAWYASEHTLSIHSIDTTRREAWYWLAILFTFALGTAAGDLTAERLDVGYLRSAVLFALLIALVTAVHFTVKRRLSTEHRRQASNAVLAFWIAYVLTRPLGAWIGDFLSQPRADGGLGLGTVVTSAVFLGAVLLAVVLLAVVYLTVSRTDQLAGEPVE